MASLRDRAWACFDAIVAAAPGRTVNPWAARPGGDPAYEPDLDTLERLLGVPVFLGAASQSGVPALALDVWVAHEFRRAGFDPDRIWPRATVPRVLPGEVLDFVASLPPGQQADLLAAVGRGAGGRASANLLGKNYVKQVDVVMSSWATGPELMVSTKRMDSSFGKNAANRVEESYGDAKNLRLRHPRAALGFCYALSAVALTEHPDTAARLIDLLIKLGREEDAYDAVGLILPRLLPVTGAGDPDPDAEPGDPGIGWPDDEEPGTPWRGGDVADERNVADGRDVADGVDAGMGSGPEGVSWALFEIEEVPSPRITAPDPSAIPRVGLDLAHVPAELDPGRFFAVLTRRILDNSPVNFHVQARACLRAARP